jgi:hypothetical protein
MYSLNYNLVLHKHIGGFCKYKQDVIPERNWRLYAEKLVFITNTNYLAV